MERKEILRYLGNWFIQLNSSVEDIGSIYMVNCDALNCIELEFSP